MKRLDVRTSEHAQLINIDNLVQKVIHESGVKEGLCHVFVPHTTAGITINENADPDVVRDIISTLDRMVPWNNNYRHSEGNSAAHVKASMMGFSVMVPIQNGQLAFGTWQSIYFCEFDGPRSRQVQVQVIAAQ